MGALGSGVATALSGDRRKAQRIAAAPSRVKGAMSMTDRLKIAFAQMNQRVGDLEGNAAAMLDMRGRAVGADLLLCPELQLIGYPPEDLVLKPEFVAGLMSARPARRCEEEPGRKSYGTRSQGGR